MIDKIAKEISDFENMPNDDSYYEACVLVAENVYKLDEDTAIKVADRIQEVYL